MKPLNAEDFKRVDRIRKLLDKRRLLRLWDPKESEDKWFVGVNKKYPGDMNPFETYYSTICEVSVDFIKEVIQERFRLLELELQAEGYEE